MAAIATDQKALAFVRKCEAAGKRVRKLIIEGKRIEVEFGDSTEYQPTTNPADLIDP